MIMKYQNIKYIHKNIIQKQLQMRIIRKYVKKDITINSLDNTLNQTTKFRAKNGLK